MGTYQSDKNKVFFDRMIDFTFIDNEIFSSGKDEVHRLRLALELLRIYELYLRTTHELNAAGIRADNLLYFSSRDPKDIGISNSIFGGKQRKSCRRKYVHDGKS